MKGKGEKGYTFLELLIIIALILIVLSVGIPMFVKFYKTYKFNKYGMELKNIVEWARAKALENKSYVWVCLEDTGYVDVCNGEGCKISVYNMRNCNGTKCVQGTLLKTLPINDTWVTIKRSTLTPSTYECFVFNPKGLAITSGDLCITNGKNYYKVILQIDRGLITESAGSGECP